MDHAGNREVFERNPVVARGEIVRQLVEIILPLVCNPLVLSLEHHDRFAPVLATLRASGNPPLGETQLPRGDAIEARMIDLRTVAGGNELRQPHINANFPARFRQRGSFFHHTHEAGVPLARFVADAEGFDLSRQRTVPAQRDPSDARQLQPPPVDLEAIPMLFVPKRTETVPALEARVSWRLARFKSSLEGGVLFYWVGDH